MHRIARTIPIIALLLAISIGYHHVVSVATVHPGEPADEQAVDDEAAVADEIDPLDDDLIDDLDDVDERISDIHQTLTEGEDAVEHSAETNKESELDDNIEAESEATEAESEATEDEVIDATTDDTEEQYVYNPMGLQVWSDDHEFIRALAGGRLALVIIIAPWCNKGAEIVEQASQAAARLDELFSPNGEDDINTIFEELGLNPSVPLSKPLIGIMNSETVAPMLLENLGGVTSYPSIKCVLTFSDNNDGTSNYDGGTEEESDILMWDYIGQREAADDLYESVLMYWYRAVLSNALQTHQYAASSHTSRSPIFSFASIDQLEKFLKSHGERLLRPAHLRYRHQTKNTLLSEVFDFYMGGKHRNISGVLHSNFLMLDGIAEHNQCTNAQPESGNFADGSKMTQEVDPYILLIQCRSLNDEHLTIVELEAEQEFNEFAEEMTHRKDVAFFSLLDETVCRQWLPHNGGRTHGAVAVFRVRRFITYSTIKTSSQDIAEGAEKSSQQFTRVVHSITTDWQGALQNLPTDIYDPITSAKVEFPHDDRKVKLSIAGDPMNANEYVRSKLVPFVITHTTPTVLWFDRYRAAQLAFPWYRKVHAVLVVDVGLPYQMQNTEPFNPYDDGKDGVVEEPLWPSKLNRSLAATHLLTAQQKAIQLFYNAALNHRINRPKDDVVFLIVPSTETRILTKFGIDIWTHLDEAAFPLDDQADNGDEPQQQSTAGYCSSGVPNSHVLPVMILTDSSGKQAKRHYLCSRDISEPSSTISQNGGSIAEYIDAFHQGTIDAPFIRSEQIRPFWRSNKNEANVTVLTGNSFESLVMERNHSHSMLLFQTMTCGHCKRFSVLWNEFSALVQAMNWGDIIEIMKIDVSKNDIIHDQVDVWDVPSVYYFPAGEKSNPIEVTWIGPKTNPQHDYDEGLSWIRSGTDLVEWIIRQGKIDIEHLIELDESKNHFDS